MNKAIKKQPYDGAVTKAFKVFGADGQLSDGIFENSRYGKVVEI